MLTGRRNKRHLVKPLAHVSIVIVIAAVIVIAYRLHLVTRTTPVPSGINWFVERVISTTGIIVLALVALVVALLHKRFERNFAIRGKVRKFFFLVLAMLTGKFYTWSGLLLAMWVLATFTNIAQPSHLYLFYALMALIVGFLVWVGARVVAFQGIHRLPPVVNQPL